MPPSADHPPHKLNEADQRLMDTALAQAEKSFAEQGLPIGAVLARGTEILAAGHNRRVQHGDPIAHGEMDCLRAAGRLRSYRDLTLFTTLTPCMMCAGTIVQFKIPRVIVGENRTFAGNEDFLRAHGVEVIVLDDARCVSLMSRFQRDYPAVWAEDIGEDAGQDNSTLIGVTGTPVIARSGATRQPPA